MSAPAMDLYYFAYGSNMDLKQMEHRRMTGTHSLWPSDENAEVKPAISLGSALLPGHILNFDKISGHRSDVNFASVAPLEGSVVEGVLYRLEEKFIEILDYYEGVKTNHYTKELAEVVLKTGKTFQAIIYIAHPNATIKTGKPGTPTKAYLDTILRGARHFQLSAELIAKLENWPTAQ